MNGISIVRPGRLALPADRLADEAFARSRKMNARIRLALLVLFVAVASQAVQAAELAPAEACALMEEEGFRGSAYAEFEPGRYRCSSLRKTLIQGEPASSDVRFLVTGNASEVQKLVLELRMRSGRAPQQVLVRFSRYAAVLLEKAAGAEMPAEVDAAIRSAVAGEWQQGESRLKLERIHDRADVYDLIFSVQ